MKNYNNLYKFIFIKCQQLYSVKVIYLQLNIPSATVIVSKYTILGILFLLYN